MHAEARNRLADELRRRLRGVPDPANRATLQRLLQRLENATDRRLPSVVAEVLVARRAVLAGCTVDAETPTPTGRTCDFRLARDGVLLHVHVKRLEAPAFHPPAIPSALRRCLRRARHDGALAVRAQRRQAAACVSAECGASSPAEGKDNL